MEEENQAPQLDVESADFDAAVRGGQFDAEAESEDIASDTGWPSPFQAALDEVDGKQPADEQAPQGAPADEQKPQEQAQPPEDWQRKYNSVAGNNRQLQTLVAQERQQRQQLADRLAQIERQAQVDRDLAQIRQVVPAELQDDAVADYHAKRASADREAGLEGYRQFLQTQQQQIQQAQVGVFQQSLPHDMPNFIGYVAEQAHAPVEPLLEIAQTDAFRELYPMIESQRDLDIVGQVVLALGQVEAKRDGARKESNRTQAVQDRTHRDVSVGGGSAASTGPDVVSRMNGMTDAQFTKFAESVRRANGANLR